MPSERIQRRIESLLDQAEVAADQKDWTASQQLAQEALALDETNQDALSLLAAAHSMLGGMSDPPKDQSPTSEPSSRVEPTTFANGRYTVKKFLGEGGKKKVYLAHDSLLDRDVAFALIKTEGLDAAARERVTREAQAMGRLGAHPHIVTVFDIGEEAGQPYLVLPVLAGGDVEGLIEKAPDNRLPLEQAIKIATETCLGLEFVHSKGIVHRDLKPGNVWLTEDGRAMIGDFGLAIAMDRSRLTQAGMMVGTVNYMPPEQAMGGTMDARSDLYSLGAMLYEMVCGRPPFVGDESVAIIGQHLTTPPVSPRWHRPDCPPALEILILRLLEKDPTSRPASATEVREALAAVRVATAAIVSQTSAVELAPDVDNPSYRRTFVGRENEVRQLQKAFDAALSGNDSLVMVVGEPGIGKTAICEQLATYVTLRGGKPLVGHCYEEGSLSLPYLAFVEAIRTYVLDRDPEDLRSELGNGAADVARVVSEVRDRLNIELRPTGDPEDDRWRLLQASTSFLRNAASVQPLVVILEDLHWADRGTLDLLLHVARNLGGSRILVVGTYRDVEVDRNHPLSGTLADLRRIEGFQRLPLRGLTPDEVLRMMSALAGQEITWTTAEAVHRQTEGNPLFVQEVQRYLIDEGLIVREGGRWRQASDTQPIAMSIPEGLRDVIGKRLARLSPECNRILAVAAVIGRDFELATLHDVTSLDEDIVISAIEEAEKVGILQDQSRPGTIRYRFAHAFFRQTLYEELSAPRRLRLHQQVAHSLETHYFRRLDEHAAELAEHFSHSTDPADLTKAVSYGEKAAHRAMSVFDYGEACRLLERALDVQEVLNPDDFLVIGRLTLALGRAMLFLRQELKVAEGTAWQALVCAEKAGDSNLAAEACQLALTALDRYSRPRLIPAGVPWLEKATHYAREGTADLAYVGLARAKHLRAERKPTASREALIEALEISRRVGNSDAFYRVASALIGSISTPIDAEQNLVIANELLSLPRETVSAANRVYAIRCCANVFQTMGSREHEDEIWKEIEDLAERSMDPSIAAEIVGHRLQKAFFAGRLEDAAEETRAFIEEGTRPEHGLSQSTTIAVVLGLRPLIYLGRYDEVIELVGGSSAEYVQRPIPGTPAHYLMFALAHAGRMEEANRIMDAWLSAPDFQFSEAPGQFLSLALETTTLLKRTEYLPPIIDALLPSAGHITNSEISCAGRLLGGASHLLNRYEEALSFYKQALDVATRTAFRPEIALTRLQIAELLLEHSPEERDVAIDHLDFAIAEFQAMKMQPALERALRHRGLLKA